MYAAVCPHSISQSTTLLHFHFLTTSFPVYNSVSTFIAITMLTAYVGEITFPTKKFPSNSFYACLYFCLLSDILSQRFIPCLFLSSLFSTAFYMYIILSNLIQPLLTKVVKICRPPTLLKTGSKVCISYKVWRDIAVTSNMYLVYQKIEHDT